MADRVVVEHRSQGATAGQKSAGKVAAGEETRGNGVKNGSIDAGWRFDGSGAGRSDGIWPGNDRSRWWWWFFQRSKFFIIELYGTR